MSENIKHTLTLNNILRLSESLEFQPNWLKLEKQRLACKSRGSSSERHVSFQAPSISGTLVTFVDGREWQRWVLVFMVFHACPHQNTLSPSLSCWKVLAESSPQELCSQQKSFDWTVLHWNIRVKSCPTKWNWFTTPCPRHPRQCREHQVPNQRWVCHPPQTS